jgi:hypothetical protein
MPITAQPHSSSPHARQTAADFTITYNKAIEAAIILPTRAHNAIDREYGPGLDPESPLLVRG